MGVDAMTTLFTDNSFTFDYSLGSGLEYLYTTGTSSSWYYWLTYTVEGSEWWIPDVCLELEGNFQLDGEYQPIGGTITRIWQWDLGYGSHYEITGISYDYGLFDAQVRAGDTAGLRTALFAGNDVMRAAGFYNSDYPWHVSLYGMGGHDTIYGHSGQDTLNGGPGNDFLRGQDGNDRLIGEGGNDTLSGGPQADEMQGGTGVAFPGIFGSAGELYYDTASKILYGNLDTDDLAELSIQVNLSGLATLTPADLVL